MANDPLRHCPTCAGPVTEDLGLRDYRWLGEALPGRVAPTDIDALIERRGHFLALEFKEGGAPIRLGQRLTLKAMVRLGFDVWCIWGPDENGMVTVGAMNRSGDVPFVDKMKVAKLRNKVKEWYEAADADQ